MSEGDLEIVGRWFKAFTDEAAFMELTHPDIEWAPFEENHTIHHGLDGAWRVVRGWSAAWSDYGGKIEEALDAGEEGIVVVLSLTARGATSGVEVDVRTYCHFKTREDKVVYLYEHVDRHEALKAAGLEE